MARLSSHIETCNRNRAMIRRIDDLSICSERSNNSTRSTISATTKKRFQNAMDSLKSANSSSLSSSQTNKRRNDSGLQRRRCRKSVSFADDPAMMVQVHYTLSIQDYSKSERSACWFVRKDYERIVEKCHQLIRKSANWDSKSRNTKLCLRGLERMSRHGFESAKRVRNIAYDTVLRLPKEDVMRNPEVVAQLYGDASVRSIKKALRVAEEDAGSATRFLGRDCI